MSLNDYYLNEVKNLLQKGFNPISFQSDQEYVDLIRQYKKLIKEGLFPFIVKSYNQKPTSKNHTEFKTITDDFFSQHQNLEYLDHNISMGAVRKCWADLEEKFKKGKEKIYLGKVKKEANITKLYSYVYACYCIHLDGLNNPIEPISPHHKKWNLYFHRIISENDGTASHSGIGSAVMIYNDNKKDFTIFNDVKNGAYNYRGKAIQTDESVLSLSFKRLKDNDQLDPKFTLEIKAFTNISSNYEIAIGAYLSYEKSSDIRIGTIIFEAVFGDRIECNQHLLCPIHLREDFMAVHESIRQFLSKKNLNQIKVKSGKHRIADLISFVKKSKERRIHQIPFFPVDKYRIFISTPVSNTESLRLKQNIIDSVIEDGAFDGLRNFLEFTCPALKGSKRANTLNYHEILMTIKSSSIFVLIYGRDNQASFSLVELGYALSNCQKVIIFCDIMCIPDQLKYFGKLESVTVIPIKDIYKYQDYLHHIKEEVYKLFSNENNLQT